MKILYLILLYACIVTDGFSQQILVDIVVKDNSSSLTLNAGLDPNATDNIDRDLGESELPPPPPEGIFYAKFVTPVNDSLANLGNGLLKDIRAGISGESSHSHRVEFQSQSGYSKDVVFLWNLPSYVSGVIEDDYGLFKKVMRGRDSLLLPYNGLRSLNVNLTYNVVIGVKSADDIILNNFALEQNYPNPFNPSTNISYNLPQDGNVLLKIYDLLGREVAVLENQYKKAGKYTIAFDAADLTSGVYIYQLQAAGKTSARKMNFLK
jgi:hypothetical protein